MAQVPGEVDNMEGLPASNNNNNPATRWDSPERGWEREPPAASTTAASLFECSRIKALAGSRRGGVGSMHLSTGALGGLEGGREGTGLDSGCWLCGPSWPETLMGASWFCAVQ